MSRATHQGQQADGRRWSVPRVPRSARLRVQLTAVGLVAVVLHVAVVSVAFIGLRAVEAAHHAVGDIVTAQRYFQDADMAHDAIRAETLLLLARNQDPEAWSGEHGTDQLEAEVDRFLARLADVDRVGLPAGLEAGVDQVRPLQEDFAAEALVVGRLAGTDVDAALERFRAMEEQHQLLVVHQQTITDAMSEEAELRRTDALRDEQDVRWGVVVSAAAALLGLLALTFLLGRLGGHLTRLLAAERDVAETLQRSLLPDRLPDLPGVRLAARYAAGGPGAEVGGDWYDVLSLPGGKVGLVMGDVVGHDLRAASSMGQLRNALRAYAAEGAEPHEVLTRLNRLCVQQGLGEMSTLLYSVLDPVSGMLVSSSAGHYPPLLMTDDGCRFLETVPCPPVGAVREAHYTSTAALLPPGSVLLLYTDGLVERRGEAVDEGLERLSRVACRLPDGRLEALCDDVLAGMLTESRSDDDVALLVVAPQTVLGERLDVVLPAQADRLAVLRQLLQRWLLEAGADEDEAYDMVVACSEAATNAVEHAYGPGAAEFGVRCEARPGEVEVVVRDWGRWREPRGQDRGRGIGLMRGLTDDVVVTHGEDGTEVRLTKRLAGASPASAHAVTDASVRRPAPGPDARPVVRA